MIQTISFRLWVAFAILMTRAFAQQPTVSVTLNTSGTGNGCCQSVSGETQGTLAPFTGMIAVNFSFQSGYLELLFTFPNSDLVRLVDPNSSTAKNTAAGTATVAWGTGSFQGVKGSIQYQINCVNSGAPHACETKDGVPYDPVQLITLGGTGSFTLPAGAVAFVPASAISSAPPPGSTIGSYHFGMNGGQGDVNFQAPVSPSSGGQFVGRQVAAQNSTAGSIVINTPLQTVDTTYTVDTTCPGLSGACWLSAPETTVTVPAFSSVPITVNMNPSLASATVLPGNISIVGAQGSGGSLNLPLNGIVSATGPTLALSETGLQFQAAAGASGSTSQTIAVTNQGTGPLTFSATPSTTSGGNWLSVSASSGTIAALAASSVTVEANPNGLAQGTYYGRIDFEAPGVLGAPESVEVVLTVSAAGSAVTPMVSPTALIFSGASPAAQTIQIVSPSSQAITVTPTVPVGGWLSVQAGASTPGSVTENISVNTSSLTPGVYQTSFTLQVAGTNITYTIPVIFIFSTSASCTPTQLLPVITDLADGFQTVAGLPVPLEAEVVDDCGDLVSNGSVTASFSSDPAISLVSLGNGIWAGTWMPQNLSGETAQVQLTANEFTPSLNGATGISGTVSANATAPVITAPGGVVSAASFAPNTPVAPGSFVTIFGSNLADAGTSAGSLPLPTTIANAQVLLGGKPMPMNYAGPTQINAIIPYDTPVDNLQQIVVVHGGVYSPAQTIVVAATQPAIFTQDGTGTGAGIVVVVKPDGAYIENSATNPASAGDSLVIYCTGLGAVSPAVTEGMAAPLTPLSLATNPVAVTIGGQTVDPAYAGLAPGFAGLYQVNVTVPAGIAPAASVPLTISAGNLTSPPVTIAIQ